MAHLHEWRTHAAVLLSLPDIDGYGEQHIIWRCATCPQQCEAWGMLHRTTRIPTPAEWEEITCAQRSSDSEWARLWRQADPTTEAHSATRRLKLVRRG